MTLAQIGSLLDPFALLIVIGGSLLGATLRGGPRAIAPALAALKPFLSADPEADALAAVVATGRVERIAQAKGVVCVERVATTGRFLRDATRRLAEAGSSDEFCRWARHDQAQRMRRHGRVIAFWRDVADTAPAMGMVATVLGLARMFMHMTDPQLIGPPMAMALVATLWGILLANLIAGPVADRLDRLSALEGDWQARTIEHFTALARAELDHARGLQATLQRSLAA